MTLIKATLSELEHQRQVLIDYCQQKLYAGDWHGVADAAMDLRELDVAIAIRERQQPLPAWESIST